MIKFNKIIVLIMIFTMICISFSNVSFAANIDKAPQDFGSFENYLEAVANESSSTLDGKALEEYRASFADPESAWQQAKDTVIGRYQLDEDDDNSGDRETILSQLDAEIDSYKQELEFNAYDANIRQYASEYYYNFFVNRRSDIENAVENSNSTEATEAFERFLSQCTVIINRIDYYLEQDLTAEELSAVQGEIAEDISNLNNNLNVLRNRNDMTESQIERMEERFDEVVDANNRFESAYDEEADAADGNDELYFAPNVSTSTGGLTGLDDMIHDGDNFISSSNRTVIDQEQLQGGISNLYNIFLEVGVAIAVIIGLIIGIKFMLGSVEEKAEIKKLLWPYAIGCFVVFGAFGIWKIALEIMQSV